MSPLDHAEDLAAKLIGNHRKFEAFGWGARPEDDENWTIVYTHNRDSDALDRSNAHVIAKALADFPETDVRAERHGHWAVGWVEGFAIRVRNDKGELTPAFLAYAELATALKDYPILDESHFSELETEEALATWENCYSDRERLEYIRKHWHQFERCHAEHYGAKAAWQCLLANVRGREFDGYASELLA